MFYRAPSSALRAGRRRPIVPQQGFHCIVDLEDVAFESCIECAATKGRCQFTASLLRGMADQARARNAEDDVRAAVARDNVEAKHSTLIHLPMLGTQPIDDLSDDLSPEDVHAAGSPPIPALSVAALTGCVRQAFLKVTEPYYQRPDQQYCAYRGTLGHLHA